MWPSELYGTILVPSLGYISSTTLLLGFLLVLKAFKAFKRDPNLVKFADLLPGPNEIPVVGNGLELFKFKGNDGIGSLISKYTQIYGPMYRLWFGNILIVVLSEPQDLEILLFSKNTYKRPPTLADYYGDTAISTNTKIHMNINVEFSFDEVKKLSDESCRPLDNYSSAFYEISNVLRIVFNIMNKKTARDAAIDSILETANKLTNDIISRESAETVLSEDQNVDKFDQPPLPTAIRKFEIDEKMENCLLHNIREILVTFTTNLSQSLAAFMFVVAAHPDIQQKLHKELDEVLDGKKPVDIDIIHRLTYMHRVFMETMRWHTISFITLRHIDEPMKIGSHAFPANTGIVIDFYNLHYNPKYYPNPEKIDPDRFLPENIKARPKCSFLPFSEGPRGCLGKNFALTSMKLMAIALLQNFSFNTNEKFENIKFSGGFIRQSVTGFNVSLERRQS